MTLHDQNHILSQLTGKQIPALIEAMERVTSKRVGGQARTLIDARGLGWPASFAGTETHCLSWRHKFDHVVSAVHPGADVALGRAMEQPSLLTTGHRDRVRLRGRPRTVRSMACS